MADASDIGGVSGLASIRVRMRSGQISQLADHVQRISEQRQHVEFIATQTHRGRDQFLGCGNAAADACYLLGQRPYYLGIDILTGEFFPVLGHPANHAAGGAGGVIAVNDVNHRPGQ